MSALGVLMGIPGADGLVADLGGGSLELARVVQGAHDWKSPPCQLVFWLLIHNSSQAPKAR